MQLRRPKFCQLEALQQKLPRAASSMCVQTMLYVYARYIYISRPYKRKPRGSFYVSLQRMYTTLTPGLDVCAVQDTMKRILILCFFTRAPAVSVFEFKR